MHAPIVLLVAATTVLVFDAPMIFFGQDSPSFADD